MDSCHLDPEPHTLDDLKSRTPAQLIAAKGPDDAQRYRVKVAQLADQDAGTLAASMGTTQDPAILWELHQELFQRGIPPILRGPRHHHGEQGDMIDFAADLQYLNLHYGTHKPRYGLAQAIWKARPDTPEWWQLVQKQFAIKGTRGARGWSIAFSLDAEQRRHLRLIQTADQRRLFDDLHGARFGELLDALHGEAIAKPDKGKSRRIGPHAVAARRARIWRIHALTAGSIRDTKSTWLALSGEATISVSTIQKTIKTTGPIFKQLRAGWSRQQTEGESC